MTKGGSLNENLLALLVCVLAAWLAYIDPSRSSILENVIYAFLGYLIGKRLYQFKD